MEQEMIPKQNRRANYLVPILGAPILFLLGLLVLYLSGYETPYYYVFYVLLQVANIALLFWGVGRIFQGFAEGNGVVRSLLSGLPTLLSLSVYEFAITFFDEFTIQIGDLSEAFAYSILTLLVQGILTDGGILLFSGLLAYLLFLRHEGGGASLDSSAILASVLYLAVLWVGRISDYVFDVQNNFGVMTEPTYRSFLLLLALDLAFALAGYLILRFLWLGLGKKRK